MPAKTPSSKSIARAWDAAELRRLAGAYNEFATALLTQPETGWVRHPDFQRRARALLRSRPGPGRTPAWLRELGRASLHLNHPCAMAQQVAAAIPLAALLEAPAAALNQSLAVWDMSPAATLIDRELMTRFKKLLGFPVGAEGSLTPGGSYANLTALLAARAALAPRAWRSGGGGIAVLTGAQSHYSIARAAGIIGLGADCVFPIRLDDNFHADPGGIADAAKTARRAGYRRLVLVATAGSSPTGGFDDLAAFGQAARKLGAWFHVDAAHGGAMAFSRRLRPLLAGLEQADSVAFDPHKMMFMPLTAGAVLVRQGARLRGAFEQHAPYLFSPVGREVADIAPFTIACSQRFDALKIWVVWQAYGSALFSELIERTCDTAHAAYAYCQNSAWLTPAHEPECNIFCFRLRRPPRSGKASDRLHWQIKEAVNAAGRAYISSTVLAGRRCLRIVVMNPRSEPAHAERVMREAERESRRLHALPR